MILFETPRLYVRRLNETDLDNLHAITGDAEVMKHIRPTISREGSKELLKSCIRAYELSPYLGRFAVMEKPGRYVGNFVLKQSEATEGIEIGYAFVKDAWGKGFATELTKEGLAFAFKTAGLQRIIAITGLENTGSQQVLIKNGFTQLPNIVDKGRTICLFEITQ